MRALITGISGFVGGHLAEHLISEGDQVLGLARVPHWPAGAPASLRSIPLVAWELGAAQGPPKETRRRIADFSPNVVFHLAAISVPADCGDTTPSPRALASNTRGVQEIIDLASSLVPRPRILFTSTSHVYAPASSDAPRDESAEVGPARPYGQTKLAGERMFQEAYSKSGLETVRARAFQHTGPRQTGPLMLPEWLGRLRAGGNTLEVRNLDTWIDLSDVRDVVRAYRLLVGLGNAGAVYNVGSGVARRTGEVLELLLKLANRDPAIRETNPGFHRDPIANIERIQRATPWRPRIPLETTLGDMLAWEGLVPDFSCPVQT